MPRDSARGRLRSHEACLNCRRKKTRCPAEKPSCSSCVRLNQPCLYTSISRSSRGGPSDDRLAFLEEKVNLILSGSRPTQDIQPEKARDGGNGVSDTTYSTRAPSNEPINIVNDPFFLGFGYDDSTSQPSSSAIAKAIDLYFEYCHRQPIWCFNRDEVSDPSCLSEELVCCLLALTSRFSRDRDHLEHYGDSARSLIMLRMANGTVELETIESLCLLAYSSFLDGNIHLGRFHLGLALHLCRSATLDLESSYVGEGPTTERKKRLFWSLQCLEQSYGQQNGFLCVPSEILRAFYVSSSSDRRLQSESEAKPPPLPTDDLGCLTSSDIGIWSLAVHFGWVWSRVRTYVSDCARNRLKEPWRHDSMYAMVLSDLTEIENKLSQCHRYDSVKFYEPTVHLYYCCAADPRLKYKSKVDFTKCRKFLKTFVSFSSACAVLDQTLDKMTRIASGSEDVDYDWEPEKIHLSIPLMWDVLQVNCKPKPHEVSTGGLLHPSLTPTVSTEEADDSPTSTLEVIVAMSPNVTVNTADGGQAAHMPPNLARTSTANYSPDLGIGEKLLAPADSLMTNTPWLWADPSQFVDLENSVGYADSESALGNIEGFSTWWDFGNL
ncbi:hypothetical protein N7499_011096 [Penicillium canescens]|nr:hypothetical protein N7499_011096 [Penicillium canescens]